MKRPITATSIIALALGTAAVVAPSATAANTDYGLGGKDGSGIIARGDQMASDLPAGSCTVARPDRGGSQTGFTWKTIEPGNTSFDKLAWGVTVSFDNSYDRTFADWLVNGTNPHVKEFIELGEVPAVEAGQPFNPDHPKSDPDLIPSHTADEVIDVDVKSSRAPRHRFPCRGTH